MKYYKHNIVDNHKSKEAALLRQPLLKNDFSLKLYLFALFPGLTSTVLIRITD
jgi:hypothetical protein